MRHGRERENGKDDTEERAGDLFFFPFEAPGVAVKQAQGQICLVQYSRQNQ